MTTINQILPILTTDEFINFVNKRLKRTREQRDGPILIAKKPEKMNTSTQQEIIDRRKQRLVRNREAAQASRERKKRKMQQLESQVAYLTDRVNFLENENKQLKELLNQLQNSKNVEKEEVNVK